MEHHVGVLVCVCMHWNLAIEDTIGTQLAVLYREVSLIQGSICTQLYVVGTTDSVLYSKCPLKRGSRVPKEPTH